MRSHLLRIREADVISSTICGAVAAGTYCSTCAREILELEALAAKESVDHYAIQRVKCSTEGCDHLALAMYGGECRECRECYEYTVSRGYDAEVQARIRARCRKALDRATTATMLLFVGGGLFCLGWHVADAVIEWLGAGGWQ